MEVRILGSFDNLTSRHMRFLQEAARLGRVHVLLLSDQAAEYRTGRKPAVSPGGTPVLCAKQSAMLTG